MTDGLTPDHLPGKRFPCGHVVSLRPILACCNLPGDAIYTPRPHRFGCAQPECNDTVEFPTIPDPRVVDGLEARLDLIEWSWRKDKPTESDRKTVSLLRYILSRIGHLSRESDAESDLESDAELLQSEPSESSLMQTLVQMETEAFALVADLGEGSAEIATRGTQEYCSYRAPNPEHSHPFYPMLSHGQECECVTPHEFEREPSSWASTPAEANVEPREEEKCKKGKTVSFVAPVVTEVQYFEPWWCAEYRDSDRYWARGPCTKSVDRATEVDDEWEILKLEDPEGWEKLMREAEDGDEDWGSDDSMSTLFGDEEEDEVLDEVGELGGEDLMAGIESEEEGDIF